VGVRVLLWRLGWGFILIDVGKRLGWFLGLFWDLFGELGGE